MQLKYIKRDTKPDKQLIVKQNIKYFAKTLYRYYERLERLRDSNYHIIKY